MSLPAWVEWLFALFGWIVSTAASVGFIRGAIRGMRDAIAKLDDRLRALELPDRAITRMEFEARQKEFFRQLGWLAEKILNGRGRRE